MDLVYSQTKSPNRTESCVKVITESTINYTGEQFWKTSVRSQGGVEGKEKQHRIPVGWVERGVPEDHDFTKEVLFLDDVPFREME